MDFFVYNYGRRFCYFVCVHEEARYRFLGEVGVECEYQEFFVEYLFQVVKDIALVLQSGQSVEWKYITNT